MLLVEQIERHVYAERQVAALLVLAGAPDVDPPNLATAIKALDDALDAPFRRVDLKKGLLMRALGVG